MEMGLPKSRKHKNVLSQHGREKSVLTGSKVADSGEADIKKGQDVHGIHVQTSPQILRKAQKALTAGVKASRKGDWAEAVKHMTVAWDMAPNDLNILTSLAHSLVQLGVREQAIEVLERALRFHEPTPEILGIMLELAVGMDFNDIGIQIGRHLVALDPDTPGNYVNLATAYLGAEQYEEAIELLQAVLPRFPEEADLWNVLANVVRLRDGIEQSEVFYQEALKHDPNNFKVLSNYAQNLERMYRFDEALEMDRRAMKASPGSPEPRLGASINLFFRGEMKEAWDLYEARFDPRRKITQNLQYTHQIPAWKGQSLAGKTLFVTAEQGIGDEIMFGNYLPFLYDEAEKLVIGCDTRLVSLYQRRFPNAVVGGYNGVVRHGYRYRYFPEIEQLIAKGELHVDYSVPVASCAQFAWLKTEDIKPHPEGFLKADPKLSKKFAKRLQEISDKPKVALAWRSGNVEGLRAAGYASIEDMGPLFAALKDKVDFINVQYGDCQAELDKVREMFGVEIHNFEDVDLKKDIEANIAIMQNCDLAVAGASAPCTFAMAAGVSTIMINPIRPWWSFGSKDHAPFARDGAFVDADLKPGEWGKTLEAVTEMAKEKLGL
ncbi:tetratricopeptide repeat protein [Kordiimonas marina]|uniref:tetratricopeptide repeat protein n=1 Tax=Kordiimonas marina TaxID=2872312 RepID=UPI001FF396F5|nr:tetratricopeptide repeat protein [Kordiimonas marina]MCJ9430316.1 tetratricopeptide repeat protein [Kordiimonas marina]